MHFTVHFSYKKRDRAFKRSLTAPVVPKRFTEYDEEFAKVTTFESQLQSLKTRQVMPIPFMARLNTPLRISRHPKAYLTRCRSLNR